MRRSRTHHSNDERIDRHLWRTWCAFSACDLPMAPDRDQDPGVMAGPPASSAARVVYAVKPASWPKLVVPACFGQTLGFAHAREFSIAAAALGMLYMVTHVSLVVLLNDWSDRRVDSLKRSMFPSSCSPKTIPDAILGERTVLGLGLTSLVACACVSLLSEHLLGRAGAFAMGLAGIAVFLAYSFPPLKLNYRGGGELLEAVGVGYLLPAFEAYLQSGAAESLASPLYVGTVLLAGSSAIASGLSDERSDLAGGKSTVVTRFGNARARTAVVSSAFAGVAAWMALSPWSILHPALVAGVVAVVGADLLRLRPLSEDAVTDAFAAQARLKSALHRVIWRGTALLGACLVLQTLYYVTRS
jgi:1,4-dihydroxy-2-naphthoate octaprenyltransferase